MKETYYSLHNHTASSNARLIDSINKVEDLIQYAYELGLKGIAITDHETVNAHIKAIKYVEKMRAKDENWKNFKLILGNEIYLCRNGLNSENYDSKKDKFYHFILLAVDEIGHQQIRELSSRAYEHSFMKNRMRRVPTYYSDVEEIIGSNPGHVIASSACLGGFLGTKLLAASSREKYQDYFLGEINMLKSWIEYIQSIFGKDNFFLELQPSDTDEQIYVNKWLLEIASDLGMDAIITTDSHYQTKDDREFHKAYLNSKEGDREVDAFYATTYLMSAEEIHEYIICKEDCTWLEAFEYCKERGGYLVRINSQKELKHIRELIKEKGYEKIQFYIGMRRDPNQKEYYLVDENNELVGQRMDNGYTEWCENVWLEGEPTYRDEVLKIEETCVSLFRYSKTGKWVFNDVPEDLIVALSTNKGKVGYICEIE